MNIEANAVVTLEVEIWDLHGTRLDASDEPLLYLHGGYDNIFEHVEQALTGKVIGDKVDVHLEPEDAFGNYDEELVRVESRTAFPAETEIGMQFEGLPEAIDPIEADQDEDGNARIYTVTDIADGVVVVDGNHQFAGIAIKFRCVVREIRAATGDEIEQGHPHDPSGGLLRVLH